LSNPFYQITSLCRLLHRPSAQQSNPAKNIADGDIVFQYIGLPVALRRDLARQVWTSNLFFYVH
jgi:hypothetical protein